MEPAFVAALLAMVVLMMMMKKRSLQNYTLPIV